MKYENLKTHLEKECTHIISIPTADEPEVKQPVPVPPPVAALPPAPAPVRLDREAQARPPHRHVQRRVLGLHGQNHNI